MIELRTPRGLPVRVPESPAEDPSVRFTRAELRAAAEYYAEHGYVIIRDLLPVAACEHVRRLWEREVKPFRGHIYRQATARAEKHSKNENGWIMNPILNLQSVDPNAFPEFRDYSTRSILTHEALSAAFQVLLADKPKLVQSMYFEGNSATWEHQDSYYLDSEVVGEMCAAWIALEDIEPTAGRFFICPGSHRIRLDDHSLYNNIAENHDTYILSVVEEIRKRNFEIRAPIMKRGDVLFWNALTIHGALDSQNPRHSRSSITCHAIPDSRRFLNLQMRVLDLKTDDINGVALYRPKDLKLMRNRVVFHVESRYPRLFYWLKKQALLYVLKSKAH